MEQRSVLLVAYVRVGCRDAHPLSNVPNIHRGVGTGVWYRVPPWRAGGLNGLWLNVLGPISDMMKHLLFTLLCGCILRVAFRIVLPFVRPSVRPFVTSRFVR